VVFQTLLFIFGVASLVALSVQAVKDAIAPLKEPTHSARPDERVQPDSPAGGPRPARTGAPEAP
jgi:hypothetical protein